jgi:Xaa-Pro aminopeptidase
MEEQYIIERERQIRQRLKKLKVDCLIITKPADVTYATGFQGGDSWAVITKRAVYLLTDSRYIEQAQAECVCCAIIQRTGSLAEAVANLLRRLKSVKTIAIEESITLDDFRTLSKNILARLKSVNAVVASLRSIKDDSEIRAIRASAAIATKALRQIRRYIKPGITEYELAGRLDFFIRKLGAKNSFETIIAFGPNASRPHHQPSLRKLRRKDSVLIDFGAKYKGYCSDITRCFAVGGSTNFYKRIYDVVQRAQVAAIRAVKEGAQIVDVDSAARETIRKNNLPVYGHGTGHGLGLEIHELPFLKDYSNDTLKTGEVITIEPGIYIPGKLGVRIEDDVLVTETGCEVLTRDCPHMKV